MPTTDPAQFADLLESAAKAIDEAKTHPGQNPPGVWQIGGTKSPELVIGTVAANALIKVCMARGLDQDKVLAGYVEAAKNISVKPKGDPAVMAANHLRDAAEELRRGDRRRYG